MINIQDQKEEVDQITEAFSMQPASFKVGTRFSGNSFDGEVLISRIVLEVVNIPLVGDPYDYKYYVGYSDEGKRLFQYKAETVNVIFK